MNKFILLMIQMKLSLIQSNHFILIILFWSDCLLLSAFFDWRWLMQHRHSEMRHEVKSVIKSYYFVLVYKLLFSAFTFSNTSNIKSHKFLIKTIIISVFSHSLSVVFFMQIIDIIADIYWQKVSYWLSDFWWWFHWDLLL